MIEWNACTEDRYYEMLEILPPAAMDRHGAFMVGEPMDHRNGAPTFSAFKCEAGHYSESADSLTFREFKSEFPAAQYSYYN